MVNRTMEITIPLFIAFFTTMLMFGEFFTDIKPIQSAAVGLRGWAVVFAGFTIVVGYLTLVRWHLKQVLKKSRSSILNAMVIVISLVWYAVGLAYGVQSPIYILLYNSTAGAVGVAMVAIAFLFAVAGAYRAFILKNVDAFFFLAPAVLLVIFYAPVGPVLSPFIPLIGDWLTVNIQRTAQRAIFIVAASGTIITLLRSLIGEEAGFVRRS